MRIGGRPLIIILIVAVLFIGLLLLVSELVIAPPRIAEVNVKQTEMQAEIGASESLPLLAVVATTQSPQAALQEVASGTPLQKNTPMPGTDGPAEQTVESGVKIPVATGTPSPFPTVEGTMIHSPTSPSPDAQGTRPAGSPTSIPETTAPTVPTATPGQPAASTPVTGSSTPIPSVTETLAPTVSTATPGQPATSTPVTGSSTPIPSVTETLAPTVSTATPGQPATSTPVTGTPTPDASATEIIDPTVTSTQVFSDLTLRVEPELILAMTDDLFTLIVNITDVNDLGGFEFELLYDPAVVWVTDVQIGDFLASTDRTDTSLGPEINNDTGITAFGGFTFGEPGGPDGSGELAAISFLAKSAGSTEVMLKNVQIVDTQAALLTPLTTSNGSVVVEAP